MSLKTGSLFIVTFLVLTTLPALSAVTHPSNTPAVSIQSESDQQVNSSKETLKTTVRLDRNVVPRGSTFRAAVMLSVNKGWHINAHEPTLDYLIPTRISYKKLHGFTVTDTRYPEGSMIRFDFADTPISVYDGNIPIFMTLAASDTLEPGSHELTGKLRVQACNDEVCLAPSEIAISIPVEVSAAGTGYQPLYGELFETYTPDGGSVTDAFTVSGGTEIAAMFSRQGYFWAFLGIFLVGLALNLTPCVYPMLSVTVSLFGGQESKQNSLGHSFSMASVYVLGIMSMYSVLGVAAAYTGSLFGSWLQNPLVLGGIGVLIFALALSMFGLYELQPPKWIMQKFSGTQRATGITGHFLSGLVVGVFAAPCIGPPIIALLAFVGSQGDPLFGFLTMFVMAFGLGVPYLLLGTFSGLLGNLPRSGTWMVWVKKLFGVVLVGVALFYLALAFAPGYAAYVIPAVLLTGGVYLAFAKTGGSESRYFRFLKWGIGTVSVIVGILTVQNLMKPGIQWESYSDEKLQQARASGTPVMLDFYADWCIPCLEMDRNTFTDPEVIAATERFKKLKVDLTRYESERAQTLRRRFEVKGVPTIVFIGSDGTARPDARVVGYLPPELFLEKVNHARNTGLSQHMPLP